MKQEKTYRVPCPFCKNWIRVSDLIPNGTSISFFADFKLSEGDFERGRCFASITGLKQKPKQEKIIFEKEEEKELF